MVRRAEQLESGFQGVLEAVTGMRQELGAEIRAVRTELSGQIVVLQDVVRTNSSDMKALRAEVRDFRHDFDHREERGRVGALEDRVSALESRLAMGSR
jgi:uncharacterized coiled-coil protein SlyX